VLEELGGAARAVELRIGGVLGEHGRGRGRILERMSQVGGRTSQEIGSRRRLKRLKVTATTGLTGLMGERDSKRRAAVL
jgi:hypothetical protein